MGEFSSDVFPMYFYRRDTRRCPVEVQEVRLHAFDTATSSGVGLGA